MGGRPESGASLSAPANSVTRCLGLGAAFPKKMRKAEKGDGVFIAVSRIN
jgi:hypothetical protein